MHMCLHARRCTASLARNPCNFATEAYICMDVLGYLCCGLVGMSLYISYTFSIGVVGIYCHLQRATASLDVNVLTSYSRSEN